MKEDLKKSMPSKRVLIISYYWPPSGGIGVHRCLKFAKYLRQFGWEPVVFTAKNAQYPVFDETNSKHIPDNLEVHKIPILEPFAAFKKLSGRKPEESANPVYVRDRKRNWIDEVSIWIRGNFFIPDARALWIRPSVRYLLRYLKSGADIHAIFSDGPPHTNTRIAYHVSRKSNIPWLADFQDPWTQVDYYKLLKISWFADRIHKRMEKQVFRTAKKITVASPTWGKDLEAIGAKETEVLYYGFDEQDFLDVEQNMLTYTANGLSGKFVISHLGLLGMDRFPKVFIQVMSELIHKNENIKKDLVLNFPGQVDYSIINYMNECGLKENLHLPGHISKNRAIAHMLQSDVLLLPLNIADNSAGRLPGKLYEYLRSYKRILALGPVDSDVNLILKESGSGECMDYDDEPKIRGFIEKAYNSFLSGNTALNLNKDYISGFDVKNQTKLLADYLNAIQDE